MVPPFVMVSPGNYTHSIIREISRQTIFQFMKLQAKEFRVGPSLKCGYLAERSTDFRWCSRIFPPKKNALRGWKWRRVLQHSEHKMWVVEGGCPLGSFPEISIGGCGRGGGILRGEWNGDGYEWGRSNLVIYVGPVISCPGGFHLKPSYPLSNHPNPLSSP